MKIKIDENSKYEDIEVIINCNKKDDRINRIVKAIETNSYNIIGRIDNEEYILELNDIYYFEAVDNRVYAYCEKEIYEVNYKILELSDLLSNTFFLQTSRTIVLNIKKIHKVKTLVNGRILAVLDNGEKSIITRVYAQNFKQKLKE